MNRHQKELRLAELKVSRDILDKQIEAIQRELTTEGLQIWTDQQNVYIPVENGHSRACGIQNHEHGPDCHPNCPTCHGLSTY